MSSQQVGEREIIGPFDEVTHAMAEVTTAKYFFVNTRRLAELLEGVQQIFYEHLEEIEHDVIQKVKPEETKLFLVAVFSQASRHLEAAIVKNDVPGPWSDDWSRDLAARVGVSPAAVPHILKGLVIDEKPSPFLLRICQPFQLDPQTLLTRYVELISRMLGEEASEADDSGRAEAGAALVATPAMEVCEAAMEVSARKFAFIKLEALKHYIQKMVMEWLPTTIDQEMSTEQIQGLSPHDVKFVVLALLTDMQRTLHARVAPSHAAAGGDWVLPWAKAVAREAQIAPAMAAQLSEPLEEAGQPTGLLETISEAVGIAPAKLLLIHKSIIDLVLEDVFKLNVDLESRGIRTQQAVPLPSGLNPTAGAAGPAAQVGASPEQMAQHVRRPIAAVAQAAAQVTQAQFAALNWEAVRRYITFFIEEWLCAEVLAKMPAVQLARLRPQSVETLVFALLSDLVRRHSETLVAGRPSGLPRWKWVEMWIDNVGDAAGVPAEAIIALVDPLADDDGAPTGTAKALAKPFNLDPAILVREHVRMAAQLAGGDGR